MAGGDTLIIKNGTYTGDGNRIKGIPSGSPGAYTAIKAESDFGVILSNLFSGTSSNQEQAPVSITRKSYIAIEGLVIKDAQGASVYAFKRHHCFRFRPHKNKKSRDKKRGSACRGIWRRDYLRRLQL